jgi:hypothetical protein
VVVDVVARVPALARHDERQRDLEDAAAPVRRDDDVGVVGLAQVVERRAELLALVVLVADAPVDGAVEDRVRLGVARRRVDAHDEDLELLREVDEVLALGNAVVDPRAALRLGERRDVEDGLRVEVLRRGEERALVELRRRRVDALDPPEMLRRTSETDEQGHAESSTGGSHHRQVRLVKHLLWLTKSCQTFAVVDQELLAISHYGEVLGQRL